MDKGDSGDEVPLIRLALGDVTNHYRKRASPSTTGKFASDNDANFETMPVGGVEGLLSKKHKTCTPKSVDGKGKCPAFSNPERSDQYVIPGSGGGTTQENEQPSVSQFAKDTGDLHTLQLVSGDFTGHRITEVEGLRRSCISFGSLTGQCDKSKGLLQESDDESQEDCEIDSAYFTKNTIQVEKSHGMSAISNENMVVDGDILTQELFDKHCSSESSGLAGSFNFKMAGLEGPSNLHPTLVGAGNNSEDITDPGKVCSCSFCLKAAYMWTDLHYQDTRGRLAALKKSRRQARSLEGKLHNHDQTVKIARDMSRTSAELEFDLMQRCRSLFLHTEDALVCETAQLHSSLLRLKDLREDCKKDLEMILDKS